MSVFNGQVANATTFNAAYLSRTVDSSTVGRIDLNNVLAASGGSITNTQRELNKLNSFLGSIANTAFDSVPTWTNNDVGGASDTVKARADFLTAAFNGTSGHNHDGSPGQGPPLSAADLMDYNDFWAELQTTTFDGALGLSDDVSASFSGETSGGGVAVEGVVTTAPYNRCELRNKLAGDRIETGGGELVYGYITWAASVWTLTYAYTDSSGVEQPYSLPAADLRIYYREVFSSANRPTFSSDAGLIDSLDLTADIVDATPSQPGKVSIAAQSFGGEKTFQDGADFQKAIAAEKLDVASGGTVTALSSANSVVKFTGVSTTTLQGVSGPSTAKMVWIYNNSSGALTLKHENAGASAANRIITSDALDLVVDQFGAVQLYYDLSQSRWVVMSTAGGGGGGTATGFGETLGTADGVATSFGPLTYAPNNAESIIVFVNGREADVSLWSQSGANIIFGTAPAAASRISVWYLENGTPAVPVMSSNFEMEYRSVSAPEAAAKSLTLAATPVDASKVALDIEGIGVQWPGTSFSVSGAVLSWSGLGMDSYPIAAGQNFRIIYLS